MSLVGWVLLALVAAGVAVGAVVHIRNRRQYARDPQPLSGADPLGATAETLSSLSPQALGTLGDDAAGFAPSEDFRGLDPGSTYGHVFDTLVDDPHTTSPPEPGTRALRSLAPGGVSLVLTRGKHRVGRSRSNDLVLDDVSVSRVHAEFSVTEQGDYTVRDMQSLNGLFVNGRKLLVTQLSPGDRVELGDARLDYVAIATGDDAS